MPHKPDPDLDERTARLGRAWFEDIRRRQRQEAVQEAAEEKRRVRRDGGTDGSLWDRLFGESDADDGGCGDD